MDIPEDYQWDSERERDRFPALKCSADFRANTRMPFPLRSSYLHFRRMKVKEKIVRYRRVKS